MWIENFEVGLGIVDLIFCLNCIDEGLEFNQSTVLFLDKDNFSNSSKIGEDIVETIMIILLR